jgi:hypothetical protein
MTADRILLLTEVKRISFQFPCKQETNIKGGKVWKPHACNWKDEHMLSALQQQSYGKSLKIHRKWFCRTLFVEVPQKVSSTIED